MIDSPRVRLALATHGRRIAVGLAVLAAVLVLAAVWTAVSPASETVTEQGDQRTVATEVEHEALVATADAPWAQGTTLENHPAYLLNASPRLDVTVATEAPEGTTVRHEIGLVLQVDRDGETVWQDARQLASGGGTVEDGSVTTDATVDVPRVHDRRTRLDEQFAGVGGVEARIVADVEYEAGGTDGSQSVDQTLATTESFYWLSGGRSTSDAVSETRTVERSEPVDWGRVLLLLLLAGGAGGGAYAVATREIDDDPDDLRRQVERERFEEWISTGSIPTDLGRNYVPIDSLEDLVDVAIDASQRVVFDARRELYAVIVDDLVYYYAPHGDWVASNAPPPGSGPGEDPNDFGGGDAPPGDRAMTDGSHVPDAETDGGSTSGASGTSSVERSESDGSEASEASRTSSDGASDGGDDAHDRR